jgi:hypothetical protein
MRKVFVTVLAEHDTNGHCKPISITWEDGRVYEINASWTCAKQRPSRPAVLAYGTNAESGKETFLFDDEGKWFLRQRNSRPVRTTWRLLLQHFAFYYFNDIIA